MKYDLNNFKNIIFNFYSKNEVYVKFILFVFVLIIFPILIYRDYLIKNGYETSNTLNEDYEVDTLDKAHRIYNDIIFTIPNIIMLFMIGNYKNTFSPISVIFVIVFTIIYNYLVSIPELNKDFISIWVSKKPSTIKIRITIIIILILGIISHLYLGYKEHILLYYIPIFLIVIFIFIGLPFIIVKKDDTTRNVHIHHSYIAFILAFFTRFDHPISKLFANILLGIYNQGISAYGRINNNFDTYTYKNYIQIVDTRQ